MKGKVMAVFAQEKTVHLSGFLVFLYMQYFTVDVEAAEGFGTDYCRWREQ